MNKPLRYSKDVAGLDPIEAYHQQWARQRAVESAQPRLRPSAELWVFVAYAILADVLSRGFGWLRLICYSVFVVSIGAVLLGLAELEPSHRVLEFVSAAMLLRSIILLARRELGL